MPSDAIAALEDRLRVLPCDAAAFWYERMASQSGQSLPVIYQPFDATQRDHWIDRGQTLDMASVAGPGAVLDFGPGDGWPALLIAPRVRAVIGLEASPRRVRVCRANARRMGITNVSFGINSREGRLPFWDGAFDGATAASSVEQTPDPRLTLRELARVLRSGGRLRMHYEGLERYRGGQEREVVMGVSPDRQARLLWFDRDLGTGFVEHLGLALRATPLAVHRALGDPAAWANSLPRETLDWLVRHTVEAGTWRTWHPTTAQWLSELRAAGFSHAAATGNGGDIAGRWFERLSPAERPPTLERVDALLWPYVVAEVQASPAPDAAHPFEPWITAVR